MSQETLNLPTFRSEPKLKIEDIAFIPLLPDDIFVEQNWRLNFATQNHWQYENTKYHIAT